MLAVGQMSPCADLAARYAHDAGRRLRAGARSASGLHGGLVDKLLEMLNDGDASGPRLMHAAFVPEKRWSGERP
jgi:hypothetical protein